MIASISASESFRACHWICSLRDLNLCLCTKFALRDELHNSHALHQRTQSELVAYRIRAVRVKFTRCRLRIKEFAATGTCSLVLFTEVPVLSDSRMALKGKVGVRPNPAARMARRQFPPSKAIVGTTDESRRRHT